jgi:hypothetical protein
MQTHKKLRLCEGEEVKKKKYVCAYKEQYPSASQQDTGNYLSRLWQTYQSELYWRYSEFKHNFRFTAIPVLTPSGSMCRSNGVSLYYGSGVLVHGIQSFKLLQSN